MVRGLVERLIFAVAVLLGVESVAFEVFAIAALVVATVVEYLLERGRSGTVLRAVERAAQLPSHAHPHDTKLLADLRKLGISPERVAAAWDRERRSRSREDEQTWRD